MLSAVVLALLLLPILEHGFAQFEPDSSKIGGMLVALEGEIDYEVSRVLWGYRQLDLLAVAFLLFVTAVGCTSILWREGEESS